jgi:uncharacterized membrane protein
MLPYIESNGAIIWGIAKGMNPFFVFFVSVSANILLIPLTFFVLDIVFSFFEKFGAVKNYLNSLQDKARPYVEKYGFFGLMFFIALPFPSTGAYSGVLASKILGIPKKDAFLSIALGIFIAGILVTVISVGVISVGFASLGLLK